MLCNIPLTAALAILGAVLPSASANLPETSAGGPTATATLINAQSTQKVYLPDIDVHSAATPIPTTSKPQRIFPNGRPDLCLTVQGGELVAGAELGIHYCHPFEDAKAKWQLFDVSGAQSNAKGGLITTHDGKLCIGLGKDHADAARPRLEPCVAADQAQVKGQAWALTVWSIRNTKDGCNQCLDIRMASPVYEGTKWNTCRDVQTWTCATTDNINPQQVWSLMNSGGVLTGSTPDERRRHVARKRSRQD